MTTPPPRGRRTKHWPAGAVTLLTPQLEVGDPDGVAVTLYRLDGVWCARTQAGTYRPVGWLGAVSLHQVLDNLADARDRIRTMETVSAELARELAEAKAGPDPRGPAE